MKRKTQNYGSNFVVVDVAIRMSEEYLITLPAVLSALLRFQVHGDPVGAERALARAAATDRLGPSRWGA